MPACTVSSCQVLLLPQEDLRTIFCGILRSWDLMFVTVGGLDQIWVSNVTTCQQCSCMHLRCVGCTSTGAVQPQTETSRCRVFLKLSPNVKLLPENQQLFVTPACLQCSATYAVRCGTLMTTDIQILYCTQCECYLGCSCQQRPVACSAKFALYAVATYALPR